jgi:DDE superfamily endonuclease
MPLPIIGAYEYVQQYLMSYRDLFSKPQYKYFVIVLLGFIQCQQARTLSGLQRGVAEAGSLSGLSRFFAEAPWDAEALVVRWQERFRTQMMPVVQAELTRQQQMHPKRRGRPKQPAVTGYFIGDDSTMHKEKGRKMEGLGRHHSPTHEQRVRGHSLVQGLYVLGERHCPVAPRLYRQQHVCEREQVPFQGKIDLMIEAIQSFEPVAGTRTHVLSIVGTAPRRSGKLPANATSSSPLVSRTIAACALPMRTSPTDGDGNGSAITQPPSQPRTTSSFPGCGASRRKRSTCM